MPPTRRQLRRTPRPRQRRLQRPSRRLRRLKRPPRKRCRCRKPDRTSNPAVTGVAAIAPVITAAADETSVLGPGPGIAGSATPQAQLERRRARAMGERCETDKTAAEKASRRKAAGCFAGCGNPGRGETRSFDEATPAPQNPTRGKAEPAAGSAAAGAARTPRALATFTRAKGNRCPARPARHDADARPPRAIGLPAARPQRGPDFCPCHYRQGPDGC
jgi:hypothetical protein